MNFKQTDAGVIPNHWSVKLLEEIAVEFHGGATPSRKHNEYWGGNIAWVTSAYLDESIYLDKAADFITQTGLQNSSTRVVPKGNVLIGTRVGVGKVAINSIDIAINQDLTAMYVDESIVIPEYVVFLIRSEAVQNKIMASARGSTIKGIPRADLIKIPVPIPPISEQKRIAKSLTVMHELITAQEDTLRELRVFSRSVLQQLINGQIGLLSDEGLEDLLL